ncbi:MAG: nucleotidyltransferase family protein, partial [Candidatus Levybacteria bacterium]|nr:nucleotidyltransferase family protein [Candidatus Levybacteria bacterium]
MKAPLLHPLKTYGNSMKPIFISKDIVYYQKVPAVSLKVDDIIVVKTGSGYITHRIVYLQKKQKTISRIITKGDNNVNTETVTRLSDILGKVVLVKRNKKAFNPQDLYLFQSTLYLKEITEVTHAFDKEVINYVILKGLPLHLYFEKKHPKRLYADCDLLIHKKDLSKTF